MFIIDLPTLLENNAKIVLCPECGKPARPLGKTPVIDSETHIKTLEQAYACTTCEQQVPYPPAAGGGYSTWTLEFCFKPDGTVIYLRPAAEWFC